MAPAPLQYDGEHEDPELLCSLDGIDSAGHHEAGWKSNGDDETFRRLLELVRSQGRA